jgi:membrane associated rhomboid family serine protease
MGENPYEACHLERPIPSRLDTSIWARILYIVKHASGGALFLALLTTACNFANLKRNVPPQVASAVLTNMALFGVVFGGLIGWVVGSFRWESRMRRSKAPPPSNT